MLKIIIDEVGQSVVCWSVGQVHGPSDGQLRTRSTQFLLLKQRELRKPQEEDMEL